MRQDMADTLRLQRLYIEKIFGEGSHDIDIRFKLEQRVTVLHGVNGSGKTITLKLLAAVLEGRFEAVLEYPLTRMVLEFVDGSVLTVQKVEAPSDPRPKQASRQGPSRSSPSEPVVEVNYRNASGKETTVQLPQGPAFLDIPPEHFDSLLPDLLPHIQPLGGGLYLDQRTGRRHTRSSLLARYGQRLDESFLFRPLRKRATLELSTLSMPPVKMIPTDRLFVRDAESDDEYRSLGLPSRTLPMVQHLSNRVRTEVAEADHRYRLESSRLDASLAERLLSTQGSGAPPAPEELLGRAQAIEAVEEKLRRIGLYKDRAPRLPSRIPSEKLATIELILQDRAKKVEPFQPLVDKAERLIHSLNRKLAPKSVTLDVERGYQVFAASGKALDLTQLSSGEQHELVLLHELLFDVAAGSLVLIDEPELSLHVSWQQGLMEDLLDIARLGQVDFVLATHSPYIVGEHDELMVRLGPDPEAGA